MVARPASAYTTWYDSRDAFTTDRPRLLRTVRAQMLESPGAVSTKRSYWRAGGSVVRRGTLLLALALLALLVLAMAASPVKP